MELGESVGIGIADVKSADKPSCDHQDKKKDKYGWKARVNKWGADGKKCSGENLYKEQPNGMWPRRSEHEKDKSLGVVPEKRDNAHWASVGLSGITESDFPLQAHHLIPKNTLPKHAVCLWLCHKWNKDDTYQLDEDTEYNTDHANNGYAMPDALRLKEWKNAAKPAEKVGVAFRVMDRTKVQLHQGSHAEQLDPEKIGKILLESGNLPEVTPGDGSADSDAFEDAEIHPAGYINQVKQWLNAVAIRIEEHVEFCTEGCKKNSSGGKTMVRPLKDSVRLMNRVSYITKVFLQLNLIYACPYGAAYAACRELLQWDQDRGKYFIYKRTASGVEELTVAQVENALAGRSGKKRAREGADGDEEAPDPKRHKGSE